MAGRREDCVIRQAGGHGIGATDERGHRVFSLEASLSEFHGVFGPAHQYGDSMVHSIQAPADWQAAKGASKLRVAHAALPCKTVRRLGDDTS